MLDFFGNNNTKIPQKSPKKHKICGACPPSGKPVEPLKFPKFSFGSPKKDTTNFLVRSSLLFTS